MTKEEILNLVNNSDGYLKHNNIIIKDISQYNVVLEVTLNNNSLNPYKTAHGGLIYSLTDSAMGLLAKITTKKDSVTLSSQINYLRPGTGTKLTAIAEIIKLGKTIHVLKATVYNDQNKEVATSTATYYATN